MDFVKASIASLDLEGNVSVDKQLILFKGQSWPTMQIGTKAAGVSFKIYSLMYSLYIFKHCKLQVLVCT